MKPISKGDLVMVVGGHICDAGKIFRVKRIVAGAYIGWICDNCGVETFTDPGPWANAYKEWGAPVSWLKRIDPISAKDDIPTKEELTA